MAIIKGNIPIGHHTAWKHGYYYQKDWNGRTLVGKASHRTARPRRQASLWIGALPYYNPATTNRFELIQLGGAWLHALSSTQRTDWDNLAAANSFLNDNGDTVFPTGWEIFQHRNMHANRAFFPPNNYWPPALPSSLYAAPAAWDAPLTPLTISAIGVSGPELVFDYFSSTGLMTSPNWLSVGISCTYLSVRQRQNKHWQKMAAQSFVIDNTDGHQRADCWWGTAVNSDEQLPGKLLIVRQLSDPPNLVPSNPGFFQL